MAAARIVAGISLGTGRPRAAPLAIVLGVMVALSPVERERQPRSPLGAAPEAGGATNATRLSLPHALFQPGCGSARHESFGV